MAIFLHAATGKTVETNRAALERNAKDRGDKIRFSITNAVSLNGKEVGRLFPSHEKAIDYLAKVATEARGRTAAKAQAALRAGPKKAVAITPAIFREHIQARVTPNLRTFAAYRKAYPKAKAVFQNGRFLTVQ